MGPKNLSPDRPVRRARSRRERKEVYLLYCEGKVTERRYFESFSRVTRDGLVRIQVHNIAGRHPLQLLDAAIKEKEKAESRARREGDDNIRYDAVWVIVDVDEHGRLDELRTKAERHGIRFAISNPCFELWALLHYCEQQGYIERGALKGLLGTHMNTRGKELDSDAMHRRWPEAVARARALDLAAERAGEPHRNPTTGVWKLVSELYDRDSRGR